MHGQEMKLFTPPNLYGYFYGLVKQIPRGRVSTYGALACALGECRAARAVGQMLKENPQPIVVPCHRVIMYDGTPGGYGGPHTHRKIALLEKEGVYFKDGRVVGFKELLFTDFQTDYPLRTLREEQKRIARAVMIPKDHWREFNLILGLDVSYDGREAQGAGVLFENGVPVRKVVARMPVNFPYISGFLSYREIPVYMKILEILREENIMPELIMLDGNGILHPLGCGIGTHLHYLTGIPTVGVAKSRLCGEVGDFRKIEEFIGEFSGTGHERVAEIRCSHGLFGFAFIRDMRRIKNPVFVSPGGGISSLQALYVSASLSEYRLPEPIRLAHQAARLHGG